MYRSLMACLIGLFVVAAAPAMAADRAIIVMDASGSMWGQIGGKTKIEIARETLANVLPSIPGDMELGLIAYGHREKGACSDIEEIVAPSSQGRQAIVDAVNGLNPKGKTPLTDAVRMAADALKFTEDKATVILITDGIETCEADPCAAAAELEKAGVDLTVHVVGFGLEKGEGAQVACIAENTGGVFIEAKDAEELTDALTQVAAAPEPAPAPEPTYEIGERMEDGIDRPGNDFSSFELDDPKPAVCQAECVAENQCVAWTFVKPGVQGDKAVCWLKTPAPAKVENDCCISGVLDDRVAAIDNVTIHAVLTGGAPAFDLNGRWEYFPMEGDQPAADYVEGGYGTDFTTTLQPGRYLLRYSKDMVEAETIVEVRQGEPVDRDLVLNAGVLTVRVVPQEGAEVDGSARFDVAVGGKEGGGYGEGTIVMPAGDVSIKVSLGEASAEASLTLAAGEIAEKTVVAAVGVLVVNAVYAEGGPAVEASGMRVDVYSPKKDLNGKRKSLAGGYGPGDQFKLPPGDYVVQVALDEAVAEAPAKVTGGEMAEVVVNINAGVLAVSAPGARRIDVVSAKKDLQGKRKNFGGTYGEEFQITLHPGEYVVVATGDDFETEKEKPAAVTAAERTEVTVE